MNSGTATSEPLLQVAGLNCVIPTLQGDARVLQDIDFQVRDGETVGLVGESGSGKTMLVRSLMGIAPPGARVSGSAVIAGTDIVGAPRKVREPLWGPTVAMVFQDPMTSLNPVVRIERQLTEAMRKHLRLDRNQARERAIDLLTQVGIPDPADQLRRYPHELSGGMRQRVMIAIALSCEPRLLIADEATTALDVTVQRQILDLLQRLQQERGMAVILVSHDLGVVAGRSDRVAVMYAGRMVELAPAAALFARPRHRYTEALLGATPRIDRVDQQFVSIPGSMPNPTAPRHGCDFASRCAVATEDCRSRVPPWIAGAADPDHHHRCLHPAGAPAPATVGGRDV